MSNHFVEVLLQLVTVVIRSLLDQAGKNYCSETFDWLLGGEGRSHQATKLKPHPEKYNVQTFALEIGAV